MAFVPSIESRQKLTSEHTERSQQGDARKYEIIKQLHFVNPRSNASELSTRDRSVQHILMTLDVKKKLVEKRYPVMASHSIKLPSIFRNLPQETRYNVSEQLDQFDDRLSRRPIKPFSQLSRQESLLLRDCQGYRKLKELRQDPRYPHNLSTSHCS